MSDLEAAIAKLNAVRDLHKDTHRTVEPWAAGYKWTGHHCTHDGQSWPCETVAAMEES